MKGIVMEDASTRTAQEVLDDHLKLDENTSGRRKTGGVSSRRTSAATSQRIS
jgi:hypothetical protein